MTEKAHEALTFWLSQHPETSHPLDTKRFHQFVFQLLEDGDNISDDYLYDEVQKAKPDWSEEATNEFVRDKSILISELIQFGRFLRGE